MIATTSSKEKAALARGAGADQVIGYDSVAERVREITGGQAPAAILRRIRKTTFLDGLTAKHSPGRSGRRGPAVARTIARSQTGTG
jgi:NADPH2:quinone reductase